MSFWKKAGDALKFGATEALVGPLYALGIKERPSTGNAEVDRLLGKKDYLGKLLGTAVGADQVIKNSNMIPKGTDITGAGKNTLSKLGLSGGISFGDQAKTQSWLPIVVVVGFILILVLRPFQTGARRRR